MAGQRSGAASAGCLNVGSKLSCTPLQRIGGQAALRQQQQAQLCHRTCSTLFSARAEAAVTAATKPSMLNMGCTGRGGGGGQLLRKSRAPAALQGSGCGARRWPQPTTPRVRTSAPLAITTPTTTGTRER